MTIRSVAVSVPRRIFMTTMVMALAIGNCSLASAAEASKTTPKKPEAKTAPAAHKASKAQQAPKKAPVKVAPKEQSSAVDDLANQARADFWHGDIAGAITAYQKLIKEHPQPSWYGELGNLYYQTGQPQLAAENYYLAAKALIAKGRPLEAGALLPTLQRLDPQLAQKLLAQQSQPKEKRK
jgi:tetratricopeptide (TPR) repeat protein